jgi:hypothetical protein
MLRIFYRIFNVILASNRQVAPIFSPFLENPVNFATNATVFKLDLI